MMGLEATNPRMMVWISAVVNCRPWVSAIYSETQLVFVPRADGIIHMEVLRMGYRALVGADSASDEFARRHQPVFESQKDAWMTRVAHNRPFHNP